MDRLLKISDKHIFHVHTYRCGHAEDVPDEAYIRKAMEKGATKITFTDHAGIYRYMPGYSARN